MKFQLIGRASYEYSYNEDPVVRDISFEFDCSTHEEAIARAEKYLKDSEISTIEDGKLKKYDEFTATLREVRPVAEFSFIPPSPGEEARRRRVIPAIPAKAPRPAHIRVKKLTNPEPAP